MNQTSKLAYAIHPIGMACSLIVLVSIIGLALLNRKLANRMTVRLVAAIAFADLLAHIGEFHSAINGKLELGSPTCNAVNGFRLFARSFYCFTNLAICFHLYRSLVQLKKPSWKYESMTWAATALLTAVFTLIYWGLGAFSGKLRKVGCNPGADDLTMNSIFFLISGLVNIVTIAVSIITTILCHRNLNKWINTFSATLTESGNHTDKLIQDRRKMAIRSFLYPLATCITLPFEAVFLILNVFGVFVLKLTLPMAVTTGLAGLLTGIAFSIDPAVHQAFRSAYQQFRNGNSDKSPSEGLKNQNDAPLGPNQ